MFWFIPTWTMQSVKMITETIFYLFGMGEDTKMTALFKSVFSGPFSIWVPYKLLSYIPSIHSLFGFYNTFFSFLFIPFGLMWGVWGGGDGLDKLMEGVDTCLNGTHAYYTIEGKNEKVTITWFNQAGCILKELKKHGSPK